MVLNGEMLYPSDRQIIYLDVAKPRALIIIQKASQDAGDLTEKVRSYISDNLKLKTEIPAIALQDDGNLRGGQKDEKDVLAPQAHLIDQMPGLVIGPDDIPTLSFTSGSEGRLVYFFSANSDPKRLQIHPGVNVF
ncbi:MAG: hypothetical protein Q9182_003051 [Xanthomendoza sp. 2 TL-2023]